jgi:hypothetical protein
MVNPEQAHSFQLLDLPRLEWEYALLVESETDGGVVVQRPPGGEWSPLAGLRPIPTGNGGVMAMPETEAERISLAKSLAYMAELDQDAWERARDAVLPGGSP